MIKTIIISFVLCLVETVTIILISPIAKPDIIEFDLQHEELLLDAERFVTEVTRVCM